MVFGVSGCEGVGFIEWFLITKYVLGSVLSPEAKRLQANKVRCNREEQLVTRPERVPSRFLWLQGER